ncbi:MAG: bifunctional riboflavin kinase/FAD synthetase [Gammaproteobacteria bacterium]
MGDTRLIRWRGRSRARSKGAVVTLGNFDGVHGAHQFMLRQVVKRARAQDLEAVVVTFEPTPLEYFQGDAAPARLMTLIEKHEAIAALGLDAHVSVRFDQSMATMSAETFASLLLHKTLNAREIIAGHDFHFGRGREGSLDTLRACGARDGYAVDEVAARYLGDLRISSTAVRDALAQSDFDQVGQLLGRRYRMSGRVVRGEQLGRTLGFATANLRPGRRVLPIEGVFAVTVSDAHELDQHPAVASLGTRPTVDGEGHLLEVHLFDFQGNLYGRRLHVDFVAKLRDEAKFSSLDAMTEQMHRDALEARALLTA